ncbi:hypothetical protein V6Z11_A11G211200 [Gossypium hirsutum]
MLFFRFYFPLFFFIIILKHLEIKERPYKMPWIPFAWSKSKLRGNLRLESSRIAGMWVTVMVAQHWSAEREIRREIKGVRD